MSIVSNTEVSNVEKISFKEIVKIGNLFNVVDYNVHENYSVNPINPRNYYLTVSYKL